jgi:hypothetical protein
LAFPKTQHSACQRLRVSPAMHMAG